MNDVHYINKLENALEDLIEVFDRSGEKTTVQVYNEEGILVEAQVGPDVETVLDAAEAALYGESETAEMGVYEDSAGRSDS